jgi:hypothetical protein
MQDAAKAHRAKLQRDGGAMAGWSLAPALAGLGGLDCVVQVYPSP